MNSIYRVLFRPTLLTVPTLAIGAAASTAILIVGVGASASPERLTLWLRISGLALAGAAAGAVDDASEKVASVAPFGRARRLTLRAALAGGLAAIGWLFAAAAGSMFAALSGAGDLAAEAVAYLLVGWTVAAVALRRIGPGAGARAAGPALVGFYLAVQLIPGLDQTLSGWWPVVMACAAAGFVFAIRDPLNRGSLRPRQEGYGLRTARRPS